jgi:hypothetical protein
MKNKDLTEPQIKFNYQLTITMWMAETFLVHLTCLFACGWLPGDSNNSWCGPQCVVLHNHITINIRNCYSRASTFVVLPHKPKLNIRMSITRATEIQHKPTTAITGECSLLNVHSSIV